MFKKLGQKHLSKWKRPIKLEKLSTSAWTLFLVVFRFSTFEQTVLILISKKIVQHEVAGNFMVIIKMECKSEHYSSISDAVNVNGFAKMSFLATSRKLLRKLIALDAICSHCGNCKLFCWFIVIAKPLGSCRRSNTRGNLFFGETTLHQETRILKILGNKFATSVCAARDSLTASWLLSDGSVQRLFAS